MSLMRGVLLAGAKSEWLRRQATRRRFVRRAVSRFMPSETLDDAIGAAASLKTQGMTTILTHLGENIADEAEADRVTRHYLGILDRVEAEGLDAEASVKLTQIGLDLGRELATANLRRLAEKAAARGKRLWVDMEDSSYTDATLDVFREVFKNHRGLCIALQAYLYRTREDMEDLISRGAGVRLVKGAYMEPSTAAYPAKKDVDESFFKLGQRLLSKEARERGVWTVLGTHDPVLIQRLIDHAAASGAGKESFEFDLLYGIRREEQARLIRDGFKVRVLVSYGAYWFPWYMRRLAERPANLMFVARNMFRG